MCCILFKCYVNRSKFVYWIPVVSEWLVMVWAYYVYVVIVCLTVSDVLAEKVVLLVVYHILMGLGLWSHCKAIFATPMQPPEKFRFNEAEWDRINNEIPWIQKREEMEMLKILLRIHTMPGSQDRGLLVYCLHCKLIKPDRCHHCSRCQICVLKMDHHCPWINNCVGFHNYKFFLLFAIYTLLCCIFAPLTSLRFIVAYFSKISQGVDVPDHANQIQIVAMCIVQLLVALAIIPLLHMHWSLLLANTTTLENTRPVQLPGREPDLRLFDLGRHDNLRYTFGPSKIFWFVPLFTSMGDGAYFPLRKDIDLQSSRESTI